MAMFTHELITEIVISASAVRVWGVLEDVAAWPQWNPFVTAVVGEVVVGGAITVAATPPDGRAMKFRAIVLSADPVRGLSWVGALPVPGLFRGEHYFRLVPEGPESVRFVHGEHFSGLLVPFLRARLDGPIRRGYEAMNAALKRRAEA